MKADVLEATMSAPQETIARLELIASDLKAAGRIQNLKLNSGAEFSVSDVVLAPSAE
jgi:hypothetical protein